MKREDKLRQAYGPGAADDIEEDGYEPYLDGVAPLAWEMICVTRFESAYKPKGVREKISWFDLAREFMRPAITEDKFSVALFSPATFVGDYRKKENIELVYGVGLDIDHGLPAAPAPDPLFGLGTVYETFSDVQALIVTTHSHTRARPRCRILVPFSRPLTRDEYESGIIPIAIEVCEQAGLIVDKSCRDASRAWFLPSAPRMENFRAITTNADAPLDVDSWLANAKKAPPPIKRVTPAIQLPESRGNVARAIRYVLKMKDSVQGENGSDRAFAAACRVVGPPFFLNDTEAMSALGVFNQHKCSPPWSEKELRHKLEGARKSTGE